MAVKQPLITTFAAWEDSTAVFMMRILGLNGVAITPGSLTAIYFSVGTVLRVEDPVDVFTETYTSVITETELTPVADYVSSGLSTALPWTKDAIGRNFTHEMLATAFPSDHARYRIQYRFVPAAGVTKQFYAVFEGKINAIFGA